MNQQANDSATKVTVSMWSLQAAECGNQILIAGEPDDFQVVEEWETATEADVQTPSEVYAALSGAHPRWDTAGLHGAMSWR